MARRAHGSIDIRHNKNGTITYRARKRYPDGSYETKSFSDRDDAERWVLDVSLNVRKQAGNVRHQPVTVAAWVGQYIERNRKRWRGSTPQNYEAVLRLHIEGTALGRQQVGTLTPARVQAWVDAMTDKPATIALRLMVVSGAMEEAVRLGLVAVNPCLSVTLPRRDEPKGQAWNRDEVQRVLSVVADDPRIDAMYRLILSTGMRPGELRALQWACVEPNAVTIRRTASHYTVSEQPKGGRTRVVAIPASVAEALERWRSVAPVSAWVFPAPYDPDACLNATTWRTWHERIIEQAGVSRITLHGLRHTAATQMLAAGVPVKLVSDRLGHKSITMTLNIYVHPDQEMQMLAAERLDEWFGTTTSAENTTRSGNRDHDRDHEPTPSPE